MGVVCDFSEFDLTGYVVGLGTHAARSDLLVLTSFFSFSWSEQQSRLISGYFRR